MVDNVSEEEEFIEEIGLVFENMGLGRTPGRIIGALMVNNPPHLNMTELVETTSMSKASMSTGLTMLTSIGFVEKFSIPGERADYYRIDNDFWKKTVVYKLTSLTSLKKSIDHAVSLIQKKDEDPNPERTQTLIEMRDMYQFFEDQLPKLFEKWETKRKKMYDT